MCTNNLRDWVKEDDCNIMVLRKQYNLNKTTFRKWEKANQQTIEEYIREGNIKSSRWMNVY